MKSPFAIMRKYQRTLLAGVTLLAIVVFVLGDSLSRSQSNGAGANRVVVGTDEGDLTASQIDQLNRRRQIANQFMFRASQACEIPQNQIPQFGFGISATDHRKDVVFGYLLNQEAEKIGIVVDNSSVANFIDEFTQKKLSAGAFGDICKEMQVGQQALYKALAGELQARFAMQILSPRLPLSPEQYWDIFKKLETKRSIEAAPVYVKDFVKDVPAPDDAKLREYFETYRTEDENRSEENFTAGFKQPRKVNLQYITLRFADIRESVEKSNPVSDKDVEEYYAANKENYLDDDLPELTEDTEGDSEPGDSLFAPGTDPTEGDETEKEGQEASSEPKSETPGSEEKTEEVPAEPAKKDNAAGEVKPEEEAPAEPEKEAASEEDQSALPTEGTGIVQVQAVEKDDAEAQADAPADKPAAEEGEKGEAAPVAPAEPAAPKLEAPVEGDAKSDETEADEAPAEPKYRELDEELREEIRSQLLDDRARIKIAADAQKIFDEMEEDSDKHMTALEGDLGDLDSEENAGPQEPDAAMIAAEADAAEDFLRRLAKSRGGEYSETGAVSQLEMLMMGQSEDGELSTLDTLGQAAEPGQNQFSPRGNSAVGLAFGSDMLYGVYQVVGGISSDRFIFWKVGDIEAHVPTWDEPGIKEQVLKAWNLKEARKLAKVRAEELAKQVGDKALAESLPEGVESSETAEFSWLYEPAPLSPNPMAGKPPATLSEITFTTPIGGETRVVRPGSEFMKTVFEKLNVGEVGVAVNGDQSAYYVVRVKYTDTADPELVGDTFIKGRMFTPPMLRQFMSTPYDEISGRESQNARYEWSQEFQKARNVNWTDAEG